MWEVDTSRCVQANSLFIYRHFTLRAQGPVAAAAAAAPAQLAHRGRPEIQDRNRWRARSGWLAGAVCPAPRTVAKDSPR